MGKIIDLTNQRFGRLIVTEYIGRINKHSIYKCKCDCGGETTTTSNNLRRNHTLSCGCYNKEQFKAASITHNLSKHPLYTSWVGMRNRCYFKKHNRYKHYGAKGINVCEEWKNTFIDFYNWAISNGWNKGLSIDRIDNNKDYCPSNCKFSTTKEQNRNRTSNVTLTIDGVSKIIIEWAETVNISPTIIRDRIKRGWSIKESVFGKN